LPRTVVNTEIIKQLVRSSASVGANYIEASEFLGKKDFGLRIKICRKEAKETIYWLRLVETRADGLDKHKEALINEATELMKIFGAIVTRTSKNSRD
ncbi:MAG: four helix bundle protein, partial [Dehalococcoidia bacterium]|nr:four helix bundle protein [Dehalococcoidia bacterium]